MAVFYLERFQKIEAATTASLVAQATRTADSAKFSLWPQHPHVLWPCKTHGHQRHRPKARNACSYWTSADA